MSRDPAHSGVNLEQYKLDVTQAAVGTILQIAAEEKRRHGDLFEKELLLGILSSLASTLVFKSLSEPTEGRPPVEGEDIEGFKLTEASYLDMKDAIQEGIGLAFSGAFSVWNNARAPQYLCEINPVPEPGTVTAH